MTKRKNLILLLLIVILCAVSRLLKHPFNFTPIIAMSVFTGSYLRNKWGLFFILIAMIISDYFIGFYDIRLMFFVYLSIAISYCLARYINKRKTLKTLIIATIISSVSFFLLTNLSVWAISGWYLRDWQGLQTCFTLALPFFRNSFAGDIVYTTLFFYAYNLATKGINFRELLPSRLSEISDKS